MPKPLKHLLDNNRRWAADTTSRDPDFFRRLSGQQAPEYLWIGCADSRVPANQITGLAPGEGFAQPTRAPRVLRGRRRRQPGAGEPEHGPRARRGLRPPERREPGRALGPQLSVGAA